MNEPVQVRDLAPIQPPIAVAPQGESEPDERALPLSHYIWLLKWHRWRILAFVAFCAAGA